MDAQTINGFIFQSVVSTIVITSILGSFFFIAKMNAKKTTKNLKMHVIMTSLKLKSNF